MTGMPTGAVRRATPNFSTPAPAKVSGNADTSAFDDAYTKPDAAISSFPGSA